MLFLILIIEVILGVAPKDSVQIKKRVVEIKTQQKINEIDSLAKVNNLYIQKLDSIINSKK